MFSAQREHGPRVNLEVEQFSGGLAGAEDRGRWHRHDFFEVFWLRRGSGVFHGDFRAHPFRAGTLIFVTAGLVHAWEMTPRVAGEYLAFRPERLGETPAWIYEMPFFHDFTVAPLLVVPRREAARLATRWAGLREDFARGDAIATDAWLRLLLHEAARLWRERVGAPELPPAPEAVLARRFLAEVERTFADQPTVSRLARVLGVPPSRLSTAVGRVCGRTPGELLAERRHLEARRLLAHANLSCAEVAYRLGFSDPAHFGRAFRRREGCSPGTARRRLRR